MKYYGDFATSRTVRVRFNTRNPRTNAPDSLSGATAVVTKDGTVVTPSGGVTLTADAGSIVGYNTIVVDMSIDTTTFTAGSEYAVRLGGTPAVGGCSVLGHVVGEWSVANRFDVLTNTASAYLSTQAGGIGVPIKATTDKFLFDGSNYVKSALQAYATGQDPATLVLGATASAWNTSLTIGNKINSGGGGGADPWTVAIPGAYTTGQAGNVLGNLISTLLATAVPSTPTAGTIGETYKFINTRLDTAISGRMAAGNVTVGGYASLQDPASYVWPALATSYTGAGSFGAILGGLSPVPLPNLVQTPAAVAGNSTAPATTFAAATTAGNFLVATLWTGPTPGTITPPAGWTLAVTAANVGTASIYFRENAPATTTVTFGLANAVRWGIAISEWTGIVAASSLDQTGSSGSSAGSITTTAANELLIAVVDDMNGSGSAATSFTNSFTIRGSTTSINLEGAWASRVVTTTGTYTTNGNAGTLNGVIAGFKAVATGSGTSDPWAITLPGGYAGGQAGNVVGNLITNLIATSLPITPTAGTVGEAWKFVDTRLDANITSRQPSGNVTVAGYATGQDPATLVLGATASAWNTSLTIGNKINSAGSGGTDPWGVALPGSYLSTQAGGILGNWISNLMAAAVPTTPTAGTIGETYKFIDTRLDANVTSRQPSGNVTIAGYATGQDPATLVLGATASAWNTALTVGNKINAAGGAGDPWSVNIPGSYATGTAGYMMGAINTKVGLLQLDASNNIYSNVKAYFTGQSPDAIVWGATTAYNTAGTMGGLQNSPIVAGYATGQAPDYLTWNATLVTYNTTNTFGNKVQGLANAADPWTATVGTGYTSTQAGYFLNAVKVASDKLTFDGNSSVRAHVYDYESTMSPEALVWGATATAHNGSGTMGGLLNAAAPGTGAGADPWATVLGSGGYAPGQAGYVLSTVGNVTNQLNFDAFSNVSASVAAYGSNLSPDYLVWNANAATYNTAGTMGRLENGPIVAGYAVGQDPTSLVWGATTAGNNGAGTMGARLQSITNADPWAVAVGTGYLSTQAGGMLNTMSGRVDAPISGVPTSLLSSAVEPGVTFLQAMRAVAADAAGAVARVGSSNQFQVMPIGNPTGSPRMVGTMDSLYLTRTINSLAL